MPAITDYLRVVAGRLAPAPGTAPDTDNGRAQAGVRVLRVCIVLVLRLGCVYVYSCRE